MGGVGRWVDLGFFFDFFYFFYLKKQIEGIEPPPLALTGTEILLLDRMTGKVHTLKDGKLLLYFSMDWYS